jgi:leucyl aminopeptidase
MTLDIRLLGDRVAPELSPARLEVAFATTDGPAPPLPRGPARAAARLLGAELLGAADKVHLLGGTPLQAVVGLGRAADVDPEALRRAAARAIATATELRRACVSMLVPAGRARPGGRLSAEVVVESLAEGAALAADARTPRPSITPTPEAAQPPTECVLRLPTGADPARLRPALERARTRAAAVELARRLADAPANLMPPLALANLAAEAAGGAGLRTEVLGLEQLEQLGAGLLLAVGRGSARPPALGVLRYRPEGAATHVAVVGKGITFDAGGINIKPAKGMADMVHDKSGAAVAAAVAVGAAKLRLPLAVTAVLACAENLPGGSAYRPGDVLTGLDGSTVEVVDTDAEGRLVLADALTYAVRLDEPRPPDAVVDLATLTGSIVAALGNEAAGVFSNDDRLARRLLDAAADAGEPCWRMPILAGHRAQLKSERADRKQCAERWGDCAIAAAFLEHYVAGRPWVHLDIAGVSYNEGSPEWPPYHPKSGAAGAGVRTVLRLLEGWDA